MCCGVEIHHGGWHWGYRHGGSCACDWPYHFGPRFWTKEEKVAWLEQYLEGLQEEAKVIEERIAALRGEE
jgi:hypothetical protein